jgi:hypothetical protein
MVIYQAAQGDTTTSKKPYRRRSCFDRVRSASVCSRGQCRLMLTAPLGVRGVGGPPPSQSQFWPALQIYPERLDALALSHGHPRHDY